MEPVHWWLAIGTLLCAAEMLVPGFYLLPLGLAAFCAAGATALGATFTTQVLIAAGVAIALTAAARTIFRRLLFSRDEAASRTNVAALEGRKVEVVEEIPGDGRAGAVKIGGEVWSAYSLDDKPIEKTAFVIIERVDSTKAYVRRG